MFMQSNNSSSKTVSFSRVYSELKSNIDKHPSSLQGLSISSL